MRNKALLAIGFAIGYVLGARAGRARYDQLARAGANLWGSPQVRGVREAAAAKAGEAVARAGDAAPFVNHHSDHPTRHTDVYDAMGGAR